MSENPPKKVHGIVAEYSSVDSLLDACRRVRDAGFTKTDAFTPFAVHGIDKALGIKPTGLPWIVLACGLIGLVTGLSMQIWMNAIDYPYIISGKPFVLSLPAFMPVVFELTVLFSSFGAFFGMWALNGLPRYSNPVFTDPRFDRATDDRFFLYIDAKDDRFDDGGVRKLLGDTGTQYIQSVIDDDSSAAVPRPFFMVWGLAVALSIVPLLLVLKMRITTSSSPRFHVFYDMDFSPAKDAQQNTNLFADGRAMRPDVPGTVARGELGQDMDFLTGIDLEALARTDARRAERLVRNYLDPLAQDKSSGDEPDDAEESESAASEEKPKKSVEEPAKPEDDSAKPEEDAAKPEEDASKPEQAEDAKVPAKAQDADAVKPSEDTAEPAADGEPAESSGTPADSASAAEETSGDAAGAGPPSIMDTTPWLEENPLPLTTDLITRGQKYFGIYCSVCHGVNGSGNGLVNRRARKILASTWIPPSRLNDPVLYQDKYPDGKLFNTISNGIRKMPGYAGQIKAYDRWAIVAYVRALQRSQDASIDVVPEDRRQEILKLKAEVDKKLQDQAEADRKAEEERAQKAAEKST